MSDNRSVVAIRIEFRNLKGKSTQEAYEFFSRYLGEPDEKDEWNGEIDYFDYQQYKVKRDYGRWALDLPIDNQGDDYYPDHLISHNDFFKKINDLNEKIPFTPSGVNISFVSYTWYTGTDEPIRFE